MDRCSKPKNTFTCGNCGENFTRISNLLWHRRTTHNVESFCCSTFRRSFNMRDNYQRHTRNHVKNLHKGSHTRNRPTQRSAKLREISLLEINKHIGLYVLAREYGIFYFILGELHSWEESLKLLYNQTMSWNSCTIKRHHTCMYLAQFKYLCVTGVTMKRYVKFIYYANFG